MSIQLRRCFRTVGLDSIPTTDTPTSDEDDPVLHELDVYISKSLGKVLLAQYPLRPTYKPYQNAARESVKVRPVQSEVEVDMVIQNNPNKPKQVGSHKMESRRM